MNRVLLSLSLLSLAAGLVQAQPDSLQVRLYHGLDEIGSGTNYFWYVRNSFFWTKLQGNANGLYRRPEGSQGDLKTEALLHGEIGRSLRPDLDLKTIFESNYYQFQQFEGPRPVMPPTVPPAPNWNLSQLSTSPPGPMQLINRSMLGLGGTYHPKNEVTVTGIAGGRWDRREGFYDQGYNASLAAQADSLNMGGYWNDLDLFAEQEELGNRLNRELRLDYGLEKEFTPRSSDHLAIHYRQKRYDYHTWGIDAIGTRQDGDQSLQNQMRYDLSPGVRVLWDIQLGELRHEDRTATGSALRQETNTATALTLRTLRRPLSGWIRLKLDTGAQEDATGMKQEKGASLEQGLSWLASRRDSLDFAASVRKRQYDTSDTANFDDRDRLRYEFELFYNHSFDSRFRASGRAEVILEHLAYIFAEKSDQNNWNRVFRLAPEIYFEPHPDVSNRARFELVANTTDYDFELDPTVIRSTIYRRYTASDSLTLAVTRGWNLVGEYSLSLEDGGRLLWDEWVQQISEEYRSHLASLVVERRTADGVRLDAGLSVYLRKGWQYSTGPDEQTQKSPFLYLTRWGPLMQLSYPSSSRIRIEAVGDLSWVHEWGHADYTLVNLDLRATWR